MVHIYKHIYKDTHMHIMFYIYIITQPWKEEILLFMATWMNMKGIMLSEITQKKPNSIWPHLHVEPKKETNKRNKIKQKLTIHAESKQVAARGETGGDGCEIGEGD